MAGSDVFVAHYESPIGRIEIEGSDAGVSALNFLEAGSAKPGRRGKGPLPSPLAECLTQLDEYFQGGRTSFSVKLDLRGTDFQKKVWAKLLSVKFGRTTTYKALAAAVGNPASTRAVGGANHRNPVSIMRGLLGVGMDPILACFSPGLSNEKTVVAFVPEEPILPP